MKEIWEGNHIFARSAFESNQGLSNKNCQDWKISRKVAKTLLLGNGLVQAASLG